MAAEMARQFWRGPGTRGWWQSPGGPRFWLYSTDEPMTSDDGEVVLVRVCVPKLIPLVGHWEHQREVWVSTLDDPGPYRFRGRIDLDLERDEWVVHARHPEHRGLVELGRYHERGEAIRALVWRTP